MGFVEFSKKDGMGKKISVLREDIVRIEESAFDSKDAFVKVHLKDASPILLENPMKDVLNIIDNDFTKHIRQQRETLQERMDIPSYGGIQDVIKAMRKSVEWNAYIAELTEMHYQQTPVSNNPKLTDIYDATKLTPYDEAWVYIAEQEFPLEVLTYYPTVVPTGTYLRTMKYDDILDMKSRDPLWLTRILRQAKFDTDRDIRVYHDKLAQKFIFLQEDILLKGTKDIALLQNRPDPYGTVSPSKQHMEQSQEIVDTLLKGMGATTLEDVRTQGGEVR